MTRDLNCTEYQATVGLSVYALGFALFPMFLAPLSEEFGRQPLYVGSTFILLLTHLGVALSVHSFELPKDFQLIKISFAELKIFRP